MPFGVFDKRLTPLAKAPSVTIHKREVISLHKAAHDLVDAAETVELFYDRERQVMALRATDDSFPHAYAVRNGSKCGSGQAIVSATAFTQHYGIDTTATRRWKPSSRPACSAWTSPRRALSSPATAPKPRHR